MNSNQATIQKLEKMGMWGMMRALRQSMEAGASADLTPDELIAHLVDVEWDERQGRRLTRLLQLARLRYRAGLEDIDFGLHRNLEKNQLMRLADCRWVEDRQDLILTGPCGSGKSFLASMLGQQACIHGYTVCYWPARQAVRADEAVQGRRHLPSGVGQDIQETTPHPRRLRAGGP